MRKLVDAVSTLTHSRMVFDDESLIPPTGTCRSRPGTRAIDLHDPCLDACREVN